MIVLVCGFCWTMAYILAIYRGYKDKTYGFPAMAVLFNVAWELAYAVIYPHSSPVGKVAFVWLFLDLFLLVQVVCYWKSEHPLPGRSIPPLAVVLGGLFMAMGVIIGGEKYHIWILASAFGQNLLMSLLFVLMLFSRDDARGQSVYIGVLKMVGTGIVVTPLLLNPSPTHTLFKKGVYAGILLLDLVYVLGIYLKIRRQGMSPLLRL
ncbi:MAG: hypothetical protein GY737_26470 [Desulfobacteraceae bacterium]|nr:hypothetical protein [Desulfobacteraceae bacterium]